MKKLFISFAVICVIARLSAQEYIYSSMTPKDSITIYRIDSETKRLSNTEENDQLNFSKFLIPHYIKLDDISSDFSFPLDSLDPDFRSDFEASIQNLEMIVTDDTVKFIDAPSGYIYYYGLISEESINFNCYMAHLSVKDGELDENYSRWYIRFDSANIISFKNELIYPNDSLGIIYFTLSLKKSNATAIDGQNVKDDKIKFYPNPFDEHITIDLGEVYSDIDISIYSIRGEIIATRYYHLVKAINLDLPLHSGIYFIKISSNNGQLDIIKLIKN